MTPHPHSFKVLDTRTGEYVSEHKQSDFHITPTGAIFMFDSYWSFAPAHYRAVFPHEERAMEFAPREGGSFVDRCNRLFPVKTKIFANIATDEFLIGEVLAPFKLLLDNDTPTLTCVATIYPWGDLLFYDYELEYNRLHPIPPCK
jgi:hypothetical protein